MLTLVSRGPLGIVRCTIPINVAQKEKEQQKKEKKQMEDKKRQEPCKAGEEQRGEQKDPDEPDAKRRRIDDILKGG